MGEIARIVDTGNFGFITVDYEEKLSFDELFFHGSTMKGGWSLKDLNRGDRVKFKYEYHPSSGKPQTRICEFINTGSASRSPTPENGPQWGNQHVVKHTHIFYEWKGSLRQSMMKSVLGI